MLEFHGSHRTLTCPDCAVQRTQEQARALGVPPECDCGALLKPDLVLFGELIPDRVLERSRRLATACSVMLVVGTSALVHPAADLPFVAVAAGAFVIEVNPRTRPITGSVSMHVQGTAAQLLPALLAGAWPGAVPAVE